MAQSDYDFTVQYGKGGQKEEESCKTCGQPMPKAAPKQPSTFADQRRTENSGNYPRPRFGGMTVAPR